MHALSIALVYFSPLIEDNECAARQIFISSNSTRVNVFFCGIKNDVASHKTSDNEKQPITKSPRRNSNTAIPFSRHINSESQSARIILFAPNPIMVEYFISLFSRYQIFFFNFTSRRSRRAGRISAALQIVSINIGLSPKRQTIRIRVHNKGKAPLKRGGEKE